MDVLPAIDYNYFMLNVTRYSVGHTTLKKLIKFFWYLETDTPVEVKHMLLPTDSIDVVINLGCPVYYSIKGRIIKAGRCHFNGMREYASLIMQKGRLRLLGISFQPYGIYPFIKMPTCKLSGHIVNLESVNHGLYTDILLAVRTIEPVACAVYALEEALLKHLSVSNRNAETIKILQAFQKWDSLIDSFCNQACVEIKWFERLCRTYTGLNPQMLKRVERIQAASSQMIQLHSTDSLTTLAYNNNYYDQSHFIREFRSFIGLTPTQFRRGCNTVKAISKYSYQ